MVMERYPAHAVALFESTRVVPIHLVFFHQGIM